jgi:serine/threonine protein kinase
MFVFPEFPMYTQSETEDGPESAIQPLKHKTFLNDNSMTHTGEVGTVGYVAPEVIENRSNDEDDQTSTYSFPVDCWSVGVVLLELFQNKVIQANKHKEAFAYIDQVLQGDDLPSSLPFPDLIRSLLIRDPELRLTAEQALRHPVFAKFGLTAPSIVRRIDMATALPFKTEAEGDDPLIENANSENQPNGKPRGADKAGPASTSKKKNDPAVIHREKQLQKRYERIGKICQSLHATNEITVDAAYEYSIQFEELEDNMDDYEKSAALLDCIVLAYRFWETSVLDLHDLNDTNRGYFSQWSLSEYTDAESTLFMLMDYCLYPRQLQSKRSTRKSR